MEDAVDSFRRHEQRSVLRGGGLAAVAGSVKMRQMLADDRSIPPARPMAQLSEEGDQPAILRHLMLLMPLPTLTASATQGLRRAATREALGAVLSHFHFLAAGRPLP